MTDLGQDALFHTGLPQIHSNYSLLFQSVLFELLIIMVNSSNSTTMESNNESDIVETDLLLPLAENTTDFLLNMDLNVTTEIYDSPRCLEKEMNEKPQDLAIILMKNYSR